MDTFDEDLAKTCSGRVLQWLRVIAYPCYRFTVCGQLSYSTGCYIYPLTLNVIYFYLLNKDQHPAKKRGIFASILSFGTPILSIVITIGSNVWFIVQGNQTYPEQFPELNWTAVQYCVIVFCILDSWYTFCWNYNILLNKDQIKTAVDRVKNSNSIVGTNMFLCRYAAVCFSSLHWAIQYSLGMNTTLHRVVTGLLLSEKVLASIYDIYQSYTYQQSSSENDSTVNLLISFLLRGLPDILTTLIGINLYFCWNYFVAQRWTSVTIALIVTNVISYLSGKSQYLQVKGDGLDAVANFLVTNSFNVFIFASVNPLLLLSYFITEYQTDKLDYSNWFLALEISIPTLLIIRFVFFLVIRRVAPHKLFKIVKLMDPTLAEEDPTETNDGISIGLSA